MNFLKILIDKQYNEIISRIFRQNGKEINEIKFDLQTQNKLQKSYIFNQPINIKIYLNIQSLSQQLNQPKQQLILAKIQDFLIQNFQELKQIILKEVNKINIGLSDINCSAGTQIQNNILDLSCGIRQKLLQQQSQLSKILESLTQQSSQELGIQTQYKLNHEYSEKSYQRKKSLLKPEGQIMRKIEEMQKNFYNKQIQTNQQK